MQISRIKNLLLNVHLLQKKKKDLTEHKTKLELFYYDNNEIILNFENQTKGLKKEKLRLLQLLNYITRKAIGFKSLRLKYREIDQVTPKCQTDVWTKVAKKV